MRDFTRDYREEDLGRIETNDNNLMSQLNEISDEKKRVEFLMERLDFHTYPIHNESDEVDTIKIRVSGNVSLDVSDLGMTIQDLLDKRITDEQRDELTSKIEELLSSQLDDNLFSFDSNFLNRFGMKVESW